MTARAKKEFRVLLPPWSVAILAAFYLPVVKTLAGRAHHPYVEGLLLEWIATLTGVGIFVACLAMAAMSFGVEIHHRTFGLMLVQPVQRSRIWWSKMLPLAGAYISVGVAFVAGQLLADTAWGNAFRPWDGNRLLFVALLAGVMCSSPFWTLQSRSIIGGMVLPLGMQALLAGVITYFAFGRTVEVQGEFEPGLFLALEVGALVYCVLFAYLGWWKFSRMEWREGFIGESVIAALTTFRVQESQPAAPCGPWASLLRKELRLHRPVFYLAALFVVCWLAVLGLKALRPAWEVQGVLGMILVIYLPLVWLLSGCLSLGEEKQLGAWGWHLTLPVSGARQWAVKISFALLIALILGILVPALACLAANAPKVEIPEGYWWGVTPSLLALLAAICGTVLSFWSVTMFGTVVRAILFTFLGAGVFLFGGAMMLRIGRETLLFPGFYRRLMVEFQLPPHYPFSSWIIVAGSFIGLSLLLVLLLRQSYVHCRREPSPGVIIRCSLILVLALFLPIWLSSDISYSCSYISPEIYSLSNNLGEAISKLPASIKEDAIEKSRPVSFEEIDRTGMLHPETKRWLRGASIRIKPFAYSPQRHPWVWVEVTFPNGRHFETAFP